MLNLIALGQISSTDSVTISRSQQRSCIKWHNELVILNDSIIPAKDSVIFHQKEFILDADSAVNELDSELTECSVNLDIQTNKRKKAIKGVIIASSIAFFEAVWIWIRETFLK